MIVIAHRGVHDVEPENSLAAFNAAVAVGADGIEFDVQATADGALVVIHDYHLDDLTDTSGFVFESSLEAVRAARLGRATGAVSDGRIPLLIEVLSLHGLSFELEVKTPDPSAVDLIVETVHDAAVESRVEFTSSYPAVLARIRKIAPAARIGLFCRRRHPLVPEHAHRHQVLAECELLQATCLHLSADMIDDDWVERCRADGLIVHAANVNDLELLDRVQKLGVDQLSTDRCDLALAGRQASSVHLT